MACRTGPGRYRLNMASVPVHVDARLLELFKENGLTDSACTYVAFGGPAPTLSTPAEEEFYGIFRGEGVLPSS